MEPTIQVGDVVVVEQISPLSATIGDVVTFRDPDDLERLITHRVRDVTARGSHVTIQTKGDANTAIESWSVSADGTIGRVVYRVPKIGYALFWIRGRYGRLILVVLPALMLGAYELWRIWRPARRGDEREPQETRDAEAA
jgi:signal peptidase